MIQKQSYFCYFHFLMIFTSDYAANHIWFHIAFTSYFWPYAQYTWWFSDLLYDDRHYIIHHLHCLMRKWTYFFLRGTNMEIYSVCFALLFFRCVPVCGLHHKQQFVAPKSQRGKMVLGHYLPAASKVHWLCMELLFYHCAFVFFWELLSITHQKCIDLADLRHHAI